MTCTERGADRVPYARAQAHRKRGSPPLGCPGARRTGGMANVEACSPRLTRLMKLRTPVHTLSPRHSPRGSQACGGPCAAAELAFPPAGLQSGPALELGPGCPQDVGCLGHGFEGPRKRMGRQPIKGEIWPERGLFSLTLIFKGAGAKSKVIWAGSRVEGRLGKPQSPTSLCPLVRECQ